MLEHRGFVKFSTQIYKWFEFFFLVMENSKEKAVAYLINEGVKEKKDKSVVEKLHPLIAMFDYALQDRILKEEVKPDTQKELIEITKAVIDVVKNPEND